MLGVNGDSPQYGLLGEVSGRKIALDLNHTHTISLFGVQGGALEVPDGSDWQPEHVYAANQSHHEGAAG